MLKNIPSILSPELLKVLDEMGHADRICIGDRMGFSSCYPRRPVDIGPRMDYTKAAPHNSRLTP